jgi:hypothetical protein
MEENIKEALIMSFGVIIFIIAVSLLFHYENIINNNNMILRDSINKDIVIHKNISDGIIRNGA